MELKRGRWYPSHSERKRLAQKYYLTLKGANDVCSSLKSKIHASGIRIRKFEERKLQFHQNKLFRINQENLYDEVNGKSVEKGEAQVSRRLQRQ